MKIRIYCEDCQKDYVIETGEPWVGLMACPHEITSHQFKEVIEDDGRGNYESNTDDSQNH